MLGMSSTNIVPLYNVKGSLSQQVVLPANSSISLVFWLQITTQEPAGSAAKDNFYVDVLSQGGALIKTELALSNRDAATGYVRRVIPLEAYAGKTVQIRFRGATDAKYLTVFRLDNVSLAAPTTITGVVTSAASGAKVSGATVTFAGGAPVVTGADGRYTLSNAPCVSGTLSAAATGYAPSNQPFTPICGTSNEKNIALAAPPTSIAGYVWDSSTNGRLLNVTATFAGQTQHTTSDGLYVLANVPCQSGSLVFTLPGYDTYRLDNYKPPKCGQSNEVDVPLVPQLTAVMGHVADADLLISISGAEVTLGTRKTTTNERGVYLFASIACAPATLTFSAPGYATVSRSVTPTCQQTSMENVRLMPDLTQITGVVTDRFTTAVLDNASVLMNKTTASTQGGSYTLTVPCAQTALQASAPGHVPVMQYFKPACGTVNQLDFALQPIPSGTSVCGRVSDFDDSRGVSGVTVSIGTRTAVTDSLGGYCIGSTLCGTPATIAFSKPGYRPTQRTQSLGCGGPTTLDVLMSQQHVDGQVVEATTSAPLVGATVKYGDDMTVTGPDGRFSFRNFCREGDRLTVTMPGFDPYSTASATGVICSNVNPAISTIKLRSNATNLFVSLFDTRTLKPVADAFAAWGSMPAVSDAKGGYAFTQALCQTAPFVTYSLRYGTNRIALTPACDATILQPVGVTPVTTSIRGVVTDGIHGGPLAGATATWMSNSAPTDRNGNFLLLYVPCGSSTLTISKAGYQSSSQTINADCRNELNSGGGVTLGP